MRHVAVPAATTALAVLVLAILASETHASDTPLVSLSSTVDYLGPFPIGRTELDGDPCESAGGIVNLHNRRRASPKSKVSLPSELVPGGAVSWSTLRADVRGVVSVAPSSVDWNALVQRKRALCRWL